MPFLIAAVVFATALGLLNLLLTLAVVRRLREHATQHAEAAPGSPESELLPAGTPLPAFTGSTAAGEVVDSATSKLELLAFMSTSCGACHEQLPALIRYITDRGIARDAALVVVVGGEHDLDGQELADKLDPVATVLPELPDGPVGSAFDARLFPTFYLVEDGVVRANAIAVDKFRALAEPTRA